MTAQSKSYMERRHLKRLYLHMKARIVLDEKEYDGYIENISENGIGYLLSASFKPRDELLSDKISELIVDIPPDTTVRLKCTVMWTKKGVFSSTTIGLGMKVINPPQEYIDWIKKERADNAGDEAAHPVIFTL